MLTQKRSPWLDRIGSLLTALLVSGLLLGWLRAISALNGFYLFALGGIGAALVSLVFLFRRLRGQALGTAGVLTCGAGLLFVLAVGTSSGDGPPINDFTTDLAHPPAFAHPRPPPQLTARSLLPARARTGTLRSNVRSGSCSRRARKAAGPRP